MKWQADQTRLDKKINSGKLKRYFTVTFRDFKIHFGIKFYFFAYLMLEKTICGLSFHIFLVSRNSCITSPKNCRKAG